MSIEELLAQFSKDIRNCNGQLVNPPVVEADIDRLRKVFGSIPRDLHLLLGQFNGENQQKWEPVNGRAFFMSVDEIIEAYELLVTADGEAPAFPESYPKEVRPYLYSQKWIPFMEYDGDIFFMDMNPTQFGRFGQIFLINVAQGCDTCEFVSNSLYELIEARINHGNSYA